MSEPEAQVEVSPGPPGGQDAPPRQEPPPGKKPGASRGIVIGIVGGLVIAGIAAGVVLPRITGDKPPAAVGEESTLEVLLPGDINAALPTLDPGTSKAAVDDAKNCKVPLAWVTLTQRPGGNGGMVRIRSGQYTSPPIKLTPVPQRVDITILNAASCKTRTTAGSTQNPVPPMSPRGWMRGPSMNLN